MENNNFKFDLIFLLKLLNKWRKEITIIVISTVILSFLGSYLITPLFKSSVIMFPAATNSVSKVLISQSFGGKDDILGFGESEQTEQMLQILNSSDLRNKVIQKFDLLNHYEIDTTSKFKLSKLYKIYESNIKFKRTEFMGVEIEVYDKNAQMACDLANNIAALYDTIKNSMQHERSYQAFKIVEAEKLISWTRKSQPYFDMEVAFEKVDEVTTIISFRMI